MALSNEELLEVLHHVREVMISNGYRDLDERLISHMRSDEHDPFNDLVRYLKSIAEFVRYSTGEELSKTLSRLRRYVRTEGGEQISGIDLVMMEADAARS
jgi:hypothetical protein